MYLVTFFSVGKHRNKCVRTCVYACIRACAHTRVAAYVCLLTFDIGLYLRYTDLFKHELKSFE